MLGALRSVREGADAYGASSCNGRRNFPSDHTADSIPNQLNALNKKVLLSVRNVKGMKPPTLCVAVDVASFLGKEKLIMLKFLKRIAISAYLQGKFQGVIAATTPTGSFMVTIRRSGLVV